MTLLINAVGIILIAFTYWFFFMKKESKAVGVESEVEITVEGGYKPNVIKIKKDRPVTLRFHRKDVSSCLEEVVISDFGVRQYLKLGEVTEIKLTPKKSGEFGFACGMNMFHGKIIVEE